jgi:2-pyrone-4,6-dicarboxylate lactonase
LNVKSMSVQTNEVVVQTFNPSPSACEIALPTNACDAHVHVFGPRDRFPYDANRSSTPQEASKEDLFAMHKKMGIGRCVIVQSMIHGFDNRVVEDAIKAGGGKYLGVALVPVNVADSELKRLANAGVRGVRFNFMKHLCAGAHTVQEVVNLTPRLKAVGMHLQVHFESSMVHELSHEFAKSSVPVVIDHMGRVDATLGVAHADFAKLFQLLRNPLFRVKVSGIDRIDAAVPFSDPSKPYFHGIELARSLVSEFPDQCLWGTDWPHPNHTHIPDDGVLINALKLIAPSEAALERLLVVNPEHFYAFKA